MEPLKTPSPPRRVTVAQMAKWITDTRHLITQPGASAALFLAQLDRLAADIGIQSDWLVKRDSGIAWDSNTAPDAHGEKLSSQNKSDSATSPGRPVTPDTRAADVHPTITDTGDSGDAASPSVWRTGSQRPQDPTTSASGAKPHGRPPKTKDSPTDNDKRASSESSASALTPSTDQEREREKEDQEKLRQVVVIKGVSKLHTQSTDDFKAWVRAIGEQTEQQMSAVMVQSYIDRLEVQPCHQDSRDKDSSTAKIYLTPEANRTQILTYLRSMVMQLGMRKTVVMPGMTKWQLRRHRAQTHLMHELRQEGKVVTFGPTPKGRRMLVDGKPVQLQELQLVYERVYVKKARETDRKHSA